MDAKHVVQHLDDNPPVKEQIDQILNVGGFDLDRALQTDPQFLEPEYPFEWIGAYDLLPGTKSDKRAD